MDHEDHEDNEEHEIDRTETGIRILYSALFALVVGVLETVVGAVVIFQLLYSLITKREPGQRVVDFGNRVSAYFYRVLRYLTHNEDEPPFPFDDFPAPVEPTRPSSDPELVERPT